MAGDPRTEFRDGMRVTGVQYGKHQRVTIEGDEYVSTIPIVSLAKALSPEAPKRVLERAAALEYISIVFVYLKLNRPIFSKTAAYGHFGRDDEDFTWERTDKADELRAAAGL